MVNESGTVREDLGSGSVTVILPVRNEERHLGACLDAVLAQDYVGGPMEILVADGRSTDRTREIVAEYRARDSRVDLVDNPGGIVPTGMNAAILRARGEFVVRVDGHCTIPGNYVSAVMRAFRETGAECVGGRMDARGEGYWGTVIARVTSHPFGVGGARFHYSSSPGEADTVYLGAYHRDALIGLGMYDEAFVRNQDDELNYRLRKSGGRVWYDPEIHADYINRSTLGKLFSQYRQYGFWKVRMYAKHIRLFNPRHAVPGLFVLAWLSGIPAFAVSRTLGTAILLGIPAVHLLAGAMFALFSRWPFRIVLAAPAAFLLMHLAYGWGTLQGLLSWPFRRGGVHRDAGEGERG